MADFFKTSIILCHFFGFFKGHSRENLNTQLATTVHINDLRSLDGAAYLTDDVIRGYLRFLCSTKTDWCVMPVLTEEIVSDAENHDRNAESNFLSANATSLHLLYPIHFRSQHWALALVNRPSTTVRYFDSLPAGHVVKSDRATNLLTMYWRSVDGRDFRVINEVCCRQANMYDCGVHVCLIAGLVADGRAPLVAPNAASNGRTTIRNSLQLPQELHGKPFYLKKTKPISHQHCGSILVNCLENISFL